MNLNKQNDSLIIHSQNINSKENINITETDIKTIDEYLNLNNKNFDLNIEDKQKIQRIIMKNFKYFKNFLSSYCDSSYITLTKFLTEDSVKNFFLLYLKNFKNIKKIKNLLPNFKTKEDFIFIVSKYSNFQSNHSEENKIVVKKIIIEQIKKLTNREIKFIKNNLILILANNLELQKKDYQARNSLDNKNLKYYFAEQIRNILLFNDLSFIVKEDYNHVLLISQHLIEILRKDSDEIEFRIPLDEYSWINNEYEGYTIYEETLADLDILDLEELNGMNYFIKLNNTNIQKILKL